MAIGAAAAVGKLLKGPVARTTACTSEPDNLPNSPTRPAATTTPPGAGTRETGADTGQHDRDRARPRGTDQLLEAPQALSVCRVRSAPKASTRSAARAGPSCSRTTPRPPDRARIRRAERPPTASRTPRGATNRRGSRGRGRPSDPRGVLVHVARRRGADDRAARVSARTTVP